MLVTEKLGLTAAAPKYGLGIARSQHVRGKWQVVDQQAGKEACHRAMSKQDS